MVKPTPAEKSFLIAESLRAVLASPEAWRSFEHEASQEQWDNFSPDRPFGKSFLDWAMVRAEYMARECWIRANQPPQPLNFNGAPGPAIQAPQNTQNTQGTLL